MKKLAFYIAALLSISSCSSTFDGENKSSSPNEEFSATRLYDEAQVAKFYPKNRGTKKISGICFLTGEGDANFDRPCMNFQLTLTDGKGEVVLRKSTDEQGRFQFLVDDARLYQLNVESRKYKMASSKIMISAGSEVLIRLVYK